MLFCEQNEEATRSGVDSREKKEDDAASEQVIYLKYMTRCASLFTKAAQLPFDFQMSIT